MNFPTFHSTSRARRAGATLLLALAVVAAGCSDDDDVAKNSSSTSTTLAAAESDGAGLTTTTTAGDNDGTPVAGSDVWSAPGEPSPLELGVGLPEPEFPAGEDGTVAEVPDGSYDAVVVQVEEASGAMLVDVVELLRGAAGVEQAIADERILEGDELPQPYYIRNLSPKMRDLRLAANVAASAEPPESGTDAPPTSAVEATGRAAVVELLVARLASAPMIPYRITVAGDEITRIVVPNIVDPTLTPGSDAQ